MSTKKGLLVAVAAGALFIGWVFLSQTNRAVSPATLLPGNHAKGSHADVGQSGETVVHAKSGDPALLTPAASPTAVASSGPSESAAGQGGVVSENQIPQLPPETVMENMRTTFHHFASEFGGNPVGTNREITRALNGGNRKQIIFINPDDGLRINEKGELVDAWGTPFFFHQLSGTEMEIHSAGPDRIMWTPDDIVLK